MTKIAVFAVSLVFVLGFAFLTVEAIVANGITAAAVISLFVLVLLTVGIVGALRHLRR